MKKRGVIILVFLCILPLFSLVSVSAVDIPMSSAIVSGTNQTEVFTLNGVYAIIDMKDSTKKFYLNFSQNLTSGTVLKMYARMNSGVPVGIYAQSDTLGAVPLATFNVSNTTGTWYNVSLTILIPTRFIWLGEGVGSGTDPKEDFDYIFASVPTVDSTPPAFSGVQTNTPSLYSSNLSFFTINWSDSSGIGSVLFESNFSGTSRNYSMYLISGSQYGFNASVSAGTFYWKSYANDSLGNMNSSSMQLFTIQKAAPQLNVLLNGAGSNLSIGYGNITNTSASRNNSGDGDVVYSFYRNGVSLSGNDTGIFGAGSYIYLYNTTGGQNYTSGSLSRNLTISQAAPSISLLINGTDSDIAISLLNSVTISASLNVPAGISLDLYENGTLIAQGNSLSIINHSYSTTGTRIWNASFVGNQNYSSLSKSHGILVVDSSAPQYSNIKTSISSGASYSSASYEFNVTWIDDVNVSNVVFQLNGVNYSYSQGQINRTGNEYFVIIPSLGAGSYSYKWYANDTANNVVSTFSQNYNIERAVTALFLIMSPSPSVFYGTNISVSCSSPNNPQSYLNLTRNTNQSNNNPDSGIFGAGSYNYACIVDISQNYSGASVTGTLTVNKATPTLFLTLNELGSNLNIASGTEVNTSASLVNPTGNISLVRNGEVIISGITAVSNTSVYSSLGTFVINATYDGNENYSAGSMSYSIIVSSPSSGGGSSGGSSGGGGGSIASIPSVASISLSIEESYIQPGTVKEVFIHASNTGKKFLNNCHPFVTGDLAQWVSSGQQKGLSPGEKDDFSLTLQPSDSVEVGDYSMNVGINCDEFVQTIPWTVHIFRNSFEPSNVKYERKGTQLSVDYNLNEFAHEDHSITLNYTLFDSDGTVISQGKKRLSLSSGESGVENLAFELPKEAFGEFNLILSFDDGRTSTSIEQKVFLSSGKLTGFTLSEGNKQALGWVGATLISLFVLFIVIRFIYFHYHRTQHKHQTRGYIQLNLK
ncbi:hypothetical protein KW787_02930 [Candidatus Pacearchaeota archaeon]|nr:hypothetical protein [Candidatus Pacearchaeota archaeon]